MFKRNELVAFGLAVVLLLSLMTFKAFVPTGMSVGVVSDMPIRAAESTHFTNLDVVEDFSVGDDATVTGDLLVSGSLTAAAGGGAVGVWTLNATDAVTVGKTLAVVGSSILTGNVNIPGILSSDTLNSLRINENTLVTGTLGVSSLATLATANVTGAFQGGSTGLFNGALTAASVVVTGSHSWGGQLVAGNGILLTQNITQVSGSFILNSGVVSGTLDVQGLVSSNAGNILQLNENTLVTGTLGVNSLATLATANVTGAFQGGSSGLFNAGVIANTGFFTTSLGVSGAASFGSTALFNDAVTMASAVITGALDLNGNLDVAGIVSSADNDFRLNDNALISGTVTTSGPISTTGAIFAYGNTYGTGPAGTLTYAKGVITGTLTAGDLSVTGPITATGPISTTGAVFAYGNLYGTGPAGALTYGVGVFTGTLAANTLSATDNVTVTNDLTVTGWVGLGGMYMAVSSTVDYTTTETLIVVANKTIYPVTSGGPAATLNDNISISDGFYLGQIIVVTNVDAQDHSVIVKNNANTKIAEDLTIFAPVGHTSVSAVFWWDGADWRFLAYP